MEYMNQSVGILDIISSKGRTGKTFIQKSIFLLQTGLNVDLGFRFKMHYYGPYSQGITEILDHLEDLGYIRINYDSEKQKYDISIKREGSTYLEEMKEYMLPNQEKDKVLGFLLRKTTEELELLSTILYFEKITNNHSECINEVTIAKPQFEERREEIEQGLELLMHEGFVV